MSIAIFDLDHTLINGDSTRSWNDFVADAGLVEREAHREANIAFNEAYHNGTLDIIAYEEFTMAVFPRLEMAELTALRDRYLHQVIEPMLLDTTEQLLDRHRADGDFLLLVTATNRFIAEPIAGLLRMDAMLGTVPAMQDGRYTGKVDGVACFGRDKITHLRAWLEGQDGFTLEGAWFYSDSHNDLPLLEMVDRPVAVNPDPVLHRLAGERGWPIIALR